MDPGAGAQSPRSARQTDHPVRGRSLGLAQLGRPFWSAILITAVFTLGRYSEAFLILRAQDRGLPATLAPLVLVMMNIVYSVAAYPAGWWSDRVGRRGLLLVAALLMAGADALLAAATGLPMVAAGVAFVGLAYGL